MSAGDSQGCATARGIVHVEQNMHAQFVNGKQFQDRGLNRQQGGFQRRAFGEGVLEGVVALESTCCFPAPPPS